MANSIVPSAFLGQLGQGPNNWYQSHFDPVRETYGELRLIHHGSRHEATPEPSPPLPISRKPPPQQFDSVLGAYGDLCSPGHGSWQGSPPEPPPQPPTSMEERQPQSWEGKMHQLNIKFERVMEKLVREREAREFQHNKGVSISNSGGFQNSSQMNLSNVYGMSFPILHTVQNYGDSTVSSPYQSHYISPLNLNPRTNQDLHYYSRTESTVKNPYQFHYVTHTTANTQPTIPVFNTQTTANPLITTPTFYQQPIQNTGATEQFGMTGYTSCYDYYNQQQTQQSQRQPLVSTFAHPDNNSYNNYCHLPLYTSHGSFSDFSHSQSGGGQQPTYGRDTYSDNSHVQPPSTAPMNHNQATFQGYATTPLVSTHTQIGSQLGMQHGSTPRFHAKDDSFMIEVEKTEESKVDCELTYAQNVESHEESKDSGKGEEKLSNVDDSVESYISEESNKEGTEEVLCLATHTETGTIKTVDLLASEVQYESCTDKNDKSMKDLMKLLFGTTLLTSGFSLVDPNTFGNRVHKTHNLGLSSEEDGTPNKSFATVSSDRSISLEEKPEMIKFMASSTRYEVSVLQSQTAYQIWDPGSNKFVLQVVCMTCPHISRDHVCSMDQLSFDLGDSWLRCIPESFISLKVPNFANINSEINFDALERLVARCKSLKVLKVNKNVSVEHLQMLLVRVPLLTEFGTGTFSQDYMVPAEVQLESVFIKCKMIERLLGEYVFNQATKKGTDENTGHVTCKYGLFFWVWDPGSAIHRGGCSCTIISREELQMAWDPGIPILMVLQTSNNREHQETSLFSIESVKLNKSYQNRRQFNISTYAKNCHQNSVLEGFVITIWDPGSKVFIS